MVDPGINGLELAFHVLKRVAQGQVCVFVRAPLGYERMAWNRDIHTHAVRATRTIVFCIEMDTNPTLSDLRLSPGKPTGMHFCSS